MEKINLNFEKNCKKTFTQLVVKAEDIVTLFPHNDCQISIEFLAKETE